MDDALWPLHQFSTEARELYWPSKIERIRCPSAIEFYRDYVSTNTPVIITGLFHSWPCLERWSSNYLKEKFGSGIVSVDITPNGRGDCVVDDVFVQPEQRQIGFGSLTS
eukprot:TRINITY_DN1701_c0_g1_i31.p1 TRINITY_DN1701_c0_g1~~TRINITY_DN1701_c0_g1_i31.p1  ORF type:complete len:109 (-),score=15.36 TRINITY_DN1701_c0_g1_i31:605-931(-)